MAAIHRGTSILSNRLFHAIKSISRTEALLLSGRCRATSNIGVEGQMSGALLHRCLWEALPPWVPADYWLGHQYLSHQLDVPGGGRIGKGAGKGLGAAE
jgi:hypothetical protein